MKIQSKATNSQTIIAEDVAIDGNVLLNGNVTIYGEIKGSVKTDGAIQLAKELGPGHTIVTILCDSGQRYQSKIWNPEFLKSKDLVVPNWL